MRKVTAGHQIESEVELSFLLNPASLSVCRPAVAQLLKNDPMSIHGPTAFSISVTLVTSSHEYFLNGPLIHSRSLPSFFLNPRYRGKRMGILRNVTFSERWPMYT